MPATDISPGVRSTPTRRRILELLEQHARPLSIPDILAADPRLAQSSVYRNLTVLDRASLVHTITPASHLAHARFELAQHDGTPVHAICNDCGHVERIGTATVVELALDGRPINTVNAKSITVISTGHHCTQGADQ